MKKLVYSIVLLNFVSLSLLAQKESGDVRSGNKLYKSGKFTESEIAYRKGLMKNQKSFEATYNLGNALFKQKKYPEALERYKQALELKPSEKNKIAAAYHNTGNALFTENKYQESIDAYKMALKNNPKDDDTRYNLAYAQAMLKKQQQKKENKNDQNKDKDKENKPEPKPTNQSQKPHPQSKPQSQMSKQNAQQILDALQQDEKNAQDKAKKPLGRGTRKAEKDW